MEFANKDLIKISPHGDHKVILIICKYTIDKEGLVKAKITELDGKAKDRVKDKLPIGLEFTFTWQVKDDTATLGDLKGDNVDILKARMEGKYEKK